MGVFPLAVTSRFAGSAAPYQTKPGTTGRNRSPYPCTFFLKYDMKIFR